MNQQILEVLNSFYKFEKELFSKLDVLVGPDEADKLLNDFVDYRERELKIGIYLDEEKHVGKDGYLKEPYKNLQRYAGLHVIYEQDNGLSLCETNNSFELIPNDLIGFETE